MSDLDLRVRQLEEKVKKLEAYQEYRGKFWSLNENEVTFRVPNGSAQITLKGDGSVSIRCSKFAMKAQGKAYITADGDLVLKGSKILQN